MHYANSTAPLRPSAAKQDTTLNPLAAKEAAEERDQLFVVATLQSSRRTTSPRTKRARRSASRSRRISGRLTWKLRTNILHALAPHRQPGTAGSLYLLSPTRSAVVLMTLCYVGKTKPREFSRGQFYYESILLTVTKPFVFLNVMLWTKFCIESEQSMRSKFKVFRVLLSIFTDKITPLS
jgi:hypothetical protein